MNGACAGIQVWLLRHIIKLLKCNRYWLVCCPFRMVPPYHIYICTRNILCKQIYIYIRACAACQSISFTTIFVAIQAIVLLPNYHWIPTDNEHNSLYKIIYAYNINQPSLYRPITNWATCYCLAVYRTAHTKTNSNKSVNPVFGFAIYKCGDIPSDRCETNSPMTTNGRVQCSS